MKQIRAIRSKHDLVYDALHEAVIQGELKPGSRLIIDDLANELGVSPIPVREALRRLEGDGFVRIEPYIGATVTEIRGEHIREIFGLLEALETVSGRAACAGLGTEGIAALESCLHDMDTLLDDPEAWSQANLRFHRLICEQAGTLLVRKMMDNALDHWDRLRTYYFQDVFRHRIREAQRDHWRMFEAIRQQETEHLKQIVHLHNQTALSAYMNYMKEENLD